MSDADDAALYLPDTPAGRAVEACAYAISDRTTPGQLGMVKRLARIVMLALLRLQGADETSKFFVKLSFDALEMRGYGRGRSGDWR